MHALFIDFETHTEKDYSLKKLPTMQYIRDSRFKVLGAAVKLDNSPAQYLEGRALLAFLKAVPWDSTLLIAHNAQFDGAIITERFRHRPAAYFCTMFAARYAIAQGLIPADYGSSLAEMGRFLGIEKLDMTEALAKEELDVYALRDLEICESFCKKFYKHLPPMERELIDLHVKMAVEPALELDKEELLRLSKADEDLLPYYEKLRKEEFFKGELLRLGVTPVYKTTPKGKQKIATSKTDNFIQGLLNDDNPEVRNLAQMKLKAHSTIERTRSQRMLDVGSPFPIPLLYYGAHTARSSGLDRLNPQNMPSEGTLRKCLIAPEGCKLIVGDSSQIEVRTVAYLAGEEKLLRAFRDNKDPYTLFASEYLFRKPEAEVTPKERKIAKAAVLALQFGQGARGFQAYCDRFGIEIDEAECIRVVSIYRQAYQAIVSFWSRTKVAFESKGELELLSGRKVVYPDVYTDGRDSYFREARIFSSGVNRESYKLWFGALVNNKVQSTARDIVFAQALELMRRGRKIVNLVHDEVVLVCKESEAEVVKQEVEAALSTAPPFASDMPLAGEVKILDYYTK